MSTRRSPVRRAVIPAAGFGTRFLPVTRSVPKVLLPVLARPLIHYAVAEAAAAGIEEIALVLSPGSEAVAAYFDEQPELERALEARGDTRLLSQQRAISAMTDVSVVVQHEARGLGHAVFTARDFIRHEPFAVLLPDDVIWSEAPAIGQLIDVHDRLGGSVVAAKEVPDEAVEALGIIDGEPVSDRVRAVRALVEKPRLADAPSNLAIIGRYVLTPAVLEHLARGRTGAGGEIQLTDAIAATIGTEPVHACAFAGEHVDAGTPAGMLAAVLREAREDPALRARVLEIVRGWERG
ncbi:MAG: NTP transferase domain-containing protein [Gemmatimonadetes bacterium]|nr:NTP transferase domain-containing protein [Gemmatimonadota bacterium]